MQEIFQRLDNDGTLNEAPEIKKRDVVKPKNNVQPVPANRDARTNRDTRTDRDTRTNRDAHARKNDTRNTIPASSFVEAAYHGRLSAVKQLLNAGADIDSRAPTSGMTALISAASRGHSQVVHYLLQAGADVNAKIRSGQARLHFTAFAYALRNKHIRIAKILSEHKDFDVNMFQGPGNNYTPLTLTPVRRDNTMEIMQVLLRKGAKVELLNRHGRTALMEAAAWSRRWQIVKLLLDAGADVNRRSQYSNQTALMLAAKHGHERVVKVLLEAEADVHIQNSNKKTALMIAAHEGRPEIVQFLVDAGANNTNLKDKDGHTAYDLAVAKWYELGRYHSDDDLPRLPYTKIINILRTDSTFLRAARSGDITAVKKFIRSGADINKQYEKGVTALWIAATKGHELVVKTLIEAGANVKLRYRGNTALMTAAEYGHLRIVKMLLAAGSNVHSSNRIGFTALIQAAKNGHKSVAKTLLEAGANPNEDSRVTPSTTLRLAAYNGHTDIVKMLIEAGANVSSPEENNSRPLVAAAKGGHERIVNILLEAGANPNSTKKDRGEVYSALYCAAKYGHLEVVKQLIKAGANINISTLISKTTPLMIAVQELQVEVVRYLITSEVDFDLRNADERGRYTARQILTRMADKAKDKSAWKHSYYAKHSTEIATMERLFRQHNPGLFDLISTWLGFAD